MRLKGINEIQHIFTYSAAISVPQTILKHVNNRFNRIGIRSTTDMIVSHSILASGVPLIPAGTASFSAIDSTLLHSNCSDPYSPSYTLVYPSSAQYHGQSIYRGDSCASEQGLPKESSLLAGKQEDSSKLLQRVRIGITQRQFQIPYALLNLLSTQRLDEVPELDHRQHAVANAAIDRENGLPNAHCNDLSNQHGRLVSRQLECARVRTVVIDHDGKVLEAAEASQRVAEDALHVPAWQQTQAEMEAPGPRCRRPPSRR